MQLNPPFFLPSVPRLSMLLVFLITLLIALVAEDIRLHTRDEIAQMVSTLAMMVCLFLSLVFSPLSIKLLIIATILISYLFQKRFGRDRTSQL